MTKPPKVTEVSELVAELDAIGILKFHLPLQLRGWVNLVGLHVQRRTFGDWIRVQAGGEYRSYFDVEGRLDKIYTDWKIRKYDEETWLNRFSHLVYPTHEIALFLCRSPFKEKAVVTLQQVAKHFDTTGEWLGLIHKKCVSCSHEITIWELQGQSCPSCKGEIGLLSEG